MATKTILHKCPVSGCQEGVPRSKLMCAPHWELVPTWLKRLVYIEYRKQPLSEDHVAAMDGATQAVNDILAGNAPPKPRKGPR